MVILGGSQSDTEIVDVSDGAANLADIEYAFRKEVMSRLQRKGFFDFGEWAYEDVDPADSDQQ